MAIRRRYKDIERFLTQILIADTAVFVLYLIFAGIGVVAIKVIASILIILASVACLALLYMTGEMRKARSRWLVLGFAAILLCLVVSLVLNYPSPAPVIAENTANLLSGGVG